MPQRGSILPVIVTVVAIALVGYTVALKTNFIQPLPLFNKLPFIPTPTPTLDQIVCTQDAKLCPDGSYVSRSGPKCEFSPCPTSPAADTKDWKTYQRDGFSFKYPNNWYIDQSGDYKETTRFFLIGEKPDYTFRMHTGKEQLIVSYYKDSSFEELRKNLKIEITMVNNRQVLLYSTGAYILVDSTNNKILSLYSPIYPNPILKKIIETLNLISAPL